MSLSYATSRYRLAFKQSEASEGSYKVKYNGFFLLFESNIHLPTVSENKSKKTVHFLGILFHGSCMWFTFKQLLDQSFKDILNQLSL